MQNMKQKRVFEMMYMAPRCRRRSIFFFPFFEMTIKIHHQEMMSREEDKIYAHTHLVGNNK